MLKASQVQKVYKEVFPFLFINNWRDKMTNLEFVVDVSSKNLDSAKYQERNSLPIVKYGVFSAQYFEPMVGGDSPQMISPTACSIKNIPVIDDF